MVPFLVDIYVVWHPDDTEGQRIAGWLLDHYHGTPYVGLVGGAIEVYTRSAPWSDGSDSPRSIPFQNPSSSGVASSHVTVVVPILGTGLAQAVKNSRSGWSSYIAMLSTAKADDQVGVFPVRLPGYVGNDQTTKLDGIQSMSAASAHDSPTLCRELSQQITQLIWAIMDESQGDRLTVFISHTKRHSPNEGSDYVNDLISQVRSKIANTHINPYFDAQDLQPGTDWEDELLNQSASNSLLAIRTDLYASREWCQREFLNAKQAGKPIVTLNATRLAKERGSFLMDHVPVVSYSDHNETTENQSIDDALNLLVDLTLSRVLWKLQAEHLSSLLNVDWTPAEAPEPITVIPWLQENSDLIGTKDQILVIHPDPPLGPAEMEIIEQLFALGGAGGEVDIVTPHTYVSRGGRGL